MSMRTHITPYPVFNAISMATSHSAVTILHSSTLASYDISWTGTSPVGTLTVELSNTYKLGADGQTVASAGNWTAIPFSNSSGTIVTSIAISGNTGTNFIDIKVTGAEAIRLTYTAVSGTGALSAVIAGKVA